MSDIAQVLAYIEITPNSTRLHRQVKAENGKIEGEMSSSIAETEVRELEAYGIPVVDFCGAPNWEGMFTLLPTPLLYEPVDFTFSGAWHEATPDSTVDHWVYLSLAAAGGARVVNAPWADDANTQRQAKAWWARRTPNERGVVDMFLGLFREHTNG